GNAARVTTCGVFLFLCKEVTSRPGSSFVRRSRSLGGASRMTKGRRASWPGWGGVASGVGLRGARGVQPGAVRTDHSLLFHNGLSPHDRRKGAALDGCPVPGGGRVEEVTDVYCPHCGRPMTLIDGVFTCVPGGMPLSRAMHATLAGR